MQMYEQVSASDLVVQVTAAALSDSSVDEENRVSVFLCHWWKHCL